MAWPHCERLMTCPNYFFISFTHPPNQTILFTPTYLHPEISDRRPAFPICLGGVCWSCYHYLFLHLRLRCYSCPVSHQCDRIFCHLILSRSRGSVPPSYAWYRSSRSFTSILCRIPDLRRHLISSSLTGPGRPCRS